MGEGGDVFTDAPDHCSNIDSPIFCEFKTVFRLKIGWNFANKKFFTLKFFSKKNYRRELERCLFDRKFCTEKLWNGIFFDKVNRWADMTSYVDFSSFCDVMYEKMTYDVISPHTFTLSKMSCCKAFQYKIFDRTSYFRALYDNFEVCRKKHLNG